MSVGILLITHSGIGSALLNVAYGTFGKLPLEIAQLSVSRDPEPELLISQANQWIKKLDAGNGVLILTDIFGSTPSNVAQGLMHQGHGIKVVSGLNLPMLFRILNYPHLNLNQLAKKAVRSGQEGIFESHQPDFSLTENFSSEPNQKPRKSPHSPSNATD